MKLEYKVIWYEDAQVYIKANKEKIRELIKTYKLVPTIDIGNENIDIEELTKKRYDLILMDYRLNSTTGDKLIRSIRDGQIYTDVVFYSGDQDAFKLNLEGVFYSSRNREALFSKIEALIQKNLKRTMEVSNLRGMVMDSTSDFDSKMKDIILKIWESISQDEKTKEIAYIKDKLLTKAKESEIQKYDECIKLQDLTIMDIFNNEKHIMDSNKRANLLTELLKIKNDKVQLASQKIKDSEIHDNHKSKRDFHSRYIEDILKYRNCLAHAKKELTDGEDIYIGEINNKPVYFDAKLCEEIREKLIKYGNLLDELFNCLE